MVRGTTPTIKYNIGLDTSKIVECVVSFKQFKIELLTKTYDDLVMSDKVVSVTLTQEETLGFEAGDLFTQIKIKTQDGKVYASPILKMKVINALCCDVL